MQPSRCRHQRFARLQMQMKGVGQHHLGAGFGQLGRADALDGACGAHRHEARRVDDAMGGVEMPAAGPGLTTAGRHREGEGWGRGAQEGSAGAAAAWRAEARGQAGACTAAAPASGWGPLVPPPLGPSLSCWTPCWAQVRPWFRAPLAGVAAGSGRGLDLLFGTAWLVPHRASF